MTKELIYVGLSGGVDSAVTLALTLKNNPESKAIFMRNWSKDLPGFQCPWREDWHDAQSVALSLNASIELWDFEKDYKDKVVDYLIAEYKAGRTPNPDIICNQEIKFKVFLERALELGATKISTGHYARIIQDDKNRFWLKTAKDETKDQSYFLARISQEALSKTIFPLGDLEKSEVRKIASKLNLPVANKKDSVGICFVGEIGIVDFLKNYLDLKPGPIVDIASNQIIGKHEGSELYTIGQRHGLSLSSGNELPYYVVSKDTQKNTVYVSSDISSDEVWVDQVKLTDCHFPTIQPDELSNYANLSLRTRHLGKLESIGSVNYTENGIITIKLKEKIKTPASGQTGVVYSNEGLVILSGFIT
jgi:tRNA-specific 2-thiouridylase